MDHFGFFRLGIMKPKIIFSDFDGTLTDGVKFTAEFLQVVDLLENNNIPMVIVTGRSKSWAHFFLTHFPSLKVVISEGGGVISRAGDDTIISDELMVEVDVIEKLGHFCHKLQVRFPNLPLTADSFGRQCDCAIDLIDLKKIPSLQDEVEQFMKEEEVNFSVSSVHLNFWCGDISKFKAVDYYLHHLGLSESNCLYFGDAPNDQSMFKHFTHSVGVSNIEKVIDQLTFKPKVVLKGVENRGPMGVLAYLTDLLK